MQLKTGTYFRLDGDYIGRYGKVIAVTSSQAIVEFYQEGEQEVMGQTTRLDRFVRRQVYNLDDTPDSILPHDKRH